MKMPISEFKAKCTQVVRDVGVKYGEVELTNRGKVVARLVPPVAEEGPDPGQFFGSLKGTVSYKPGWDAPLGDEDWEACR